MGNRLTLQKILEDLMESKNVYYQPPQSISMKYPCIKYSLSDIDKKSGDNIAYSITNCYDLIVIDKKPDNPVIRKLLEMPMSSFDRHYVSDNLYHDVIRLYY